MRIRQRAGVADGRIRRPAAEDGAQPPKCARKYGSIAVSSCSGEWVMVCLSYRKRRSVATSDPDPAPLRRNRSTLLRDGVACGDADCAVDLSD